MSFLALAIIPFIFKFAHYHITRPAAFPFQALVRAVVYAKCVPIYKLLFWLIFLAVREKNISKL